jgi:putative ABC transport system substrate-binding protein
MLSMRRREFVALLGGAAAARPFTAHAQQPARPVIGFVHLTSMEETKEYLPAFHEGLRDAGYVEGKKRRDRIPVGTGPK